MRLGIFEGEIRYIFYPGSRLIEQQAPSRLNSRMFATFTTPASYSAAADQTAGGR